MGQINSTQDSETVASLPAGQNEEESMGQAEKKSKRSLSETERESNLEQGQCVKTRIDMLIEEFLNTEKGADKDTEKHFVAKCTIEQEKKEVKRNFMKKVDDGDVVKIKNNNSDNSKSKPVLAKCERKDSFVPNDHVKEEPKTDLKVSDIITDMVSTELTQKQLKQLQQRTITTFNTFIDKVLDNSLSKDNMDIKETKPTNLLQLCAESMIPSDKQKGDCETVKSDNPKDNDSSEKDCDGNDKPECDRDLERSKQDTKEVKVSLKDHIERFLEISFKNENFDEETKPTDKKKSLNENFNAQGLVNSMINQGVQINRLLKTKDQLNESLKPCPENSNKPVPERMSRNPEPQKQRGEDLQRPEGKVDRLGHHANTSAFRENYPRLHEEYTRKDDILHRNRETLLKAQKQDLSNQRKPGHSSPFQQQHLHVASQNYYHQAYSGRLQGSPGQLRDKKPGAHDVKQSIHMRDCPCPVCIHPPQPKHSLGDGHGIEQIQGKRSPIIPSLGHNTAAGHRPDVQTLLRPSQLEGTQGLMAYQGMHNIIPYHPTSTAPKLYGGNQLLVMGDNSHGMMASRRSSYPETHSQHSPYYYRREEFPQSLVTSEHNALRSSQHSPYLSRPASGHGQEQTSYIYSRSNSGHLAPEIDHVRKRDSHSNSSECSNDSPLDLSVKKPKPEFSPSRTTQSAPIPRKINPNNSFIKHLENSVDKYWQELNSPPHSPPHHSPVSQSGPVNDVRSSQPYERQNSSGSSSSGLFSMMPNRPLPSPQYTGGITVGQPLVDVKPQTGARTGDSPQNGSPVMARPGQAQSQFSANQSSFDAMRNASAANVSKHEPIQNIIGQHDPNDILYLICRICSQTYGSPYGFRKHFRNQHGFEPRADHTIVQTISATKTAMHMPQPELTGSVSNLQGSPESEPRLPVPSSAAQSTRRGNMSSPSDSKSNAGSESDKSEIENSETKCLECPECGKTFQLNDFGLYKRHCRQHGNVRMNGPLTCSDCHLQFSDQRSLREHYTMHVKETQVNMKQEQKADVSEGRESRQTCYSCVKCDLQFDSTESLTHHLSSHNIKPENSDKNTLVSRSIALEPQGHPKSDSGTVEPVVKQAAESNTMLACPDSSCDTVNIDTSDHNNGSLSLKGSDSSLNSNSVEDKVPNMECKDENSQSSLNSQEWSEKDSDGDNEFAYKHKKFFHHRKRAYSQHLPSASAPTNAKLAKMLSESPTSTTETTNTCTTSTVCVQNSVKEQTSLSQDDNDSSVSDMESDKEAKAVKSTVKSAGKPVRTEARHNLPFVWDRTTRSQKRL